MFVARGTPVPTLFIVLLPSANTTMAFCRQCGTEVPDTNRFCTRCGAPQSADAAATVRSAAPSSSGAGIVAGLVIGGFVVVVIVGILAAIAIPKFASVSSQAKEAEALPVLRLVVEMEKTHYASEGAFTADLAQLDGWSDPGARYFNFAIARARGPLLCVDALPNEAGRAARLGSQSMDQDFRHYDSAGCGGYSGSPEASAGIAVDTTSKAEESY